MTLNEAMHAECDLCGEQAMNHRMTGSGNFYCLEFNTEYRRSSMRTIYPIIAERRIVAQRAKCNDLKKARIPKAREVASIIRNQWQNFTSTSAEADTQLELA